MSKGDEHLDGLDPAIRAEVEAVLAGDMSYDEVSGDVQAVVRELWHRRFEEARERLDLQAEFRAQGLTWVEAEEDGSVVDRE